MSKKSKQKDLYRSILQPPASGSAPWQGQPAQGATPAPHVPAPYPGASPHGMQAPAPQPLYGETATPKRRGATLPLLLVALLFLVGLLVLLLYHGGVLQDLLSGGWNIGAPALPAGGPILSETADAGQAYVDETLFLGDSNTVRYAHHGLVPQRQVLAAPSLGIQAVSTHALPQQSGAPGQTMLQVVRQQQPARLLICFGTNDIGNMTADAFVLAYAEVLEALRDASPDTKIIVNAIPPVGARNQYPKVSNEAVGQFNTALVELCAKQNVAFLQSTDILCDTEGFCHSTYTEPDGLHLSVDALEAVLVYYRTHAWLN